MSKNCLTGCSCRAATATLGILRKKTTSTSSISSGPFCMRGRYAQWQPIATIESLFENIVHDSVSKLKLRGKRGVFVKKKSLEIYLIK